MKCPRRSENPDIGWCNENHDDTTPDGLRCNYCGSLTQEEFFKAIEAGAVLGPTDKNYKVYVNDVKKFYFQHLDDAGQRRFCELLNARKLKLGFPRYFYATPFFLTEPEPKPEVPG